MATVLLVSRDQLTRPMLAVALVGAALAVTIVDTALLRRDPSRLMTAGPVLAELGVGMALLVCDGVVYGEQHAFSTSQSLGSVWPLAGILGAGVAAGPVAACAAGVVLGLGRVTRCPAERVGHRLRRQGPVARQHRRLLRPRRRGRRLPGPPPAPGRAGDLGGEGPGGDRPHPARRRAADPRRRRAPGHRPRPGQDGEGAGAGPPGVPVRRRPARRRRDGRRRRPRPLAAQGGRPLRGGVRGHAGAGAGGRRPPAAGARGGGGHRRGRRRGPDQRRQARAGVEGARLRRTERGRRRVLLGEGRRPRVRPGRHHGGRGADPLDPGADGRGRRQGRGHERPGRGTEVLLWLP